MLSKKARLLRYFYVSTTIDKRRNDCCHISNIMLTFEHTVQVRLCKHPRTIFSAQPLCFYILSILEKKHHLGKLERQRTRKEGF